MTARQRRPRQPGILTTLLGLTIVRAILLVIGFARSRRLIERFAAAPTPTSAAREAVDTPPDLALTLATRVAQAGALFPGRAICLEQSLVLYALLRRRGVEAQLRLGVQPFPFTAHAWVEVDGAPINETEERIRHFHLLRTGS
jgi:hypothetical protein